MLLMICRILILVFACNSYEANEDMFCFEYLVISLLWYATISQSKNVEFLGTSMRSRQWDLNSSPLT
ncbi:hypothetical protein KP509_10G058800 [Ceratopteris richardii]|uniref:Uncharacterized protein n=1 Tax=Ceratopteris richardii TaxID=49495 RepID=A0A8T2TXX2_CERRI|nr:hypothetical protein KP509_10G058800 [Ceratopteris richardii]